FEFISHTSVLDRLTFMASEKPECFLSDPSENAEENLEDVIEARLNGIDEDSRLKSAMLYLAKVGLDLIKIVEASK
ncbi:hypothetical protein GCK32_010061, partial [Trichostrongylus colubriformis]